MIKTRLGTHRLFSLAAMWLGAVSVAACNGDSKGTELSGCDAFAATIKDIADPMGTIAAFRPYLEYEEESTEKYAPIRRADAIKQAFYAATMIRSATNIARQSGDRSKSPTTAELTPALRKVNKACTNPEDMDEVAKCKAELEVLDGLLEQQASKASSACPNLKFPVAKPEFITPKAKAALDLFKRAIGPTPEETKYLASRKDTDIKPQDLISGCQTAATHADEVMKELQKGSDPELGKLAAIHKLSLDSQCNKLTMADSLMTGLEDCHPDKRKKAPPPPPGEEEGDDPCARVCAQSKTLLTKGIPAAAFEKFSEAFDGSCEPTGKVKEK